MESVREGDARGVSLDKSGKLMRINLLAVSRRAATIALLVLFPGFVLYHYSLAQGWIPPFLGGLFGFGSAVMAGVAALVLPWTIYRQTERVAGQSLFVALTLGYLCLWTVANYVFLRGDSYAHDALRQSLATLVIWFALIYIGTFCDVERRGWRGALIALCLLVAAAMIHAIVRFRSPLGPWVTFASTDDDSQFSTYQAIGRSLLVCSIFLASFGRRTGVQISLLGLGMVSLLLVGSRSDFFTVAILTLGLILRAILQRKLNAGRVFAIFAVIATGFALWPLFLRSRNAEILDLSQSSSWQARHELQVAAVKVINTHPIFGDFGYYLRDSGAGAYSHNALSAWTNFGFMGFALYVGLLIYFAVLSFRRWRRFGSANSAWFVAYNLNLAALIQAIVASPVFAVLPALAWGLTLNALRQETRTST